MGLLDLLGKLTPLVDIGLCVLGVIIMIVGAAWPTYGTVDLKTPSILIGLLTSAAGGLGIFAAMRKWWGVVMLISILQTFVFSALLAVAVVAEIWAIDMKAPIAEAVDDNWSSGLRQNVALQGQVVPDYCNDWMPGDSLCKPWYGEVEVFMSTRAHFISSLTDEEFDAAYPGCPSTIELSKIAENCTQADICGLSKVQCSECDMDCRYTFEEAMYNTIAGSALMSITLWTFSSIYIYWSWFYDSIETAATTAQEVLEEGRAGGEQLKVLQAAVDRLGTKGMSWQMILNYVCHFICFVCAISVTGSGALTFLSLSRDCEMVRQGGGESCGGWSYIVGAILSTVIGLLVILSLYGAHIQYRAVSDCARSSVGFLTLCYIPIGLIMLHSAGLVRSLRYAIDNKWEDISLELNAISYCFPDATLAADDPCKDELEADVSANLAQVAAVLWVLVMLLAGAVVVNTLYARTLFWDHVDHLAGKGGMKKRLSNDFGDMALSTMEVE